MRKAAPWIAAAAALAAVVWFWSRSGATRVRPARPEEAGAPAERAVPATPGTEAEVHAAHEGGALSRATPAPVAPQPIPMAAPKDMVFTGKVMRLRSDVVLASVNGVAITLKDLMPVSPYVLTERSLRTEMYDALLHRAVEREVALQTAKEKGVALDAAQMANLDQIRARALQRNPQSFTDAHDDYEAKADFDVRDYSGLMMQESLLAAAGGPPKYVTPEAVQKYYEQHEAEFPALPEDPAARQQAWQSIEIDIRSALAPEINQTYQQGLEQMMSNLVARAAVTQYVSAAPPP